MLDLVTLPDPRLFEISSEVKKIDGDLAGFVGRMFHTMEAKDGVGLAAVQVGLMERLFVVHIPDGQALVFINPVIQASSDRLVSWEEGCLSIPGIYSEVKRPDALQIQAYDLAGKEFSMEVDGFLARVIQHEQDHLDGRLFYQHLKDRQQQRFLRTYGRSNDRDISMLLEAGA